MTLRCIPCKTRTNRSISAMCAYLVDPVDIKVSYVRAGSPLQLPARVPWHSDAQRKIVRLSPYQGRAHPIYRASIWMGGSRQSRWEGMTRPDDHAVVDCRWQALSSVL